MDAPPKGYFRLANRNFPKKPWYKDPALRKTYICLMFVVVTSATNGYDGSMVNGLQSLEPWKKYFHPDDRELGLLNAIMGAGSLVAIPVVPYAADILSRRGGILVGCLIMVLGVVLQSISINLNMFIAARFFIGFGVAIAHGSSPLLLTELVHPQDRPIFTAIYNTTWYFGSIIAAWLTRGTFQIQNDWSWRIPSMVQAVPSLLQLSFIWLVPESPRWHIAKGKEDQALKTLADVHANGDYNDEVVQLEFEEIKETIRMERESDKNSWKELWSSPGNRHRLLILITLGLFSQWSGNGLVSYYMTKVLDSVGVKDPKTQLNINGGLQIWNFFVAVTMCFFVDNIGRRKLFLTSTSGMLACFIVWTICSERFSTTGSEASGRAVIVMIFLYYTSYNLAWSGLLVGYGVEILPFSIRAKGITIMFLFVDLALVFNQYVTPTALTHIGWKYYMIYCIWLGIELAVVWKFYIETRNTPLEEIAKHFDGEQALVGGAAATAKGRELEMTSDLKQRREIETVENGDDRVGHGQEEITDKK